VGSIKTALEHLRSQVTGRRSCFRAGIPCVRSESTLVTREGSAVRRPRAPGVAEVNFVFRVLGETVNDTPLLLGPVSGIARFRSSGAKASRYGSSLINQVVSRESSEYYKYWHDGEFKSVGIIPS
jgi:hypothetical protein